MNSETPLPHCMISYHICIYLSSRFFSDHLQTKQQLLFTAVRTQCAEIWVDRSTRFVDGLIGLLDWIERFKLEL